MKPNKPKILVGCPTSNYKEYCLKEYAEGLKKLTYDNFDVLLVDNSRDSSYRDLIEKHNIPVVKSLFLEHARERIVEARNILRKKALDGYDYLLSLEQDVIPPPDIIQRLLAHNKKIITGIYFTNAVINGRKVIVPVLYKQSKKGKDLITHFTEPEVMHNNVIEAKALGLGCVLIHRDVLEKIKFRYEKDGTSFDDMYFSLDSMNAGYTLFADCSVKCRHLVSGWNWNRIKI